MATNSAAVVEQNLHQEPESVAAFIFASDPAWRYVRRPAIIDGRGSVLMALPNAGVFKHLVELLESEGQDRASKICIVEAKELTAVQRVHALRELKEISTFAHSVMLDPRKVTGDPAIDALAMTRHLHESLEALRVALPSAFRKVDSEEQSRQAVYAAQQCWKLLCKLSEAARDSYVSPGHPLGATLEALHVRLEAVHDALAGCSGVVDFGTACSQVYRLLTSTEAEDWGFAYDILVDASDPAERFLMRAHAKFGKPQDAIPKSERDFYRKASRAIADFKRNRAKGEEPVVCSSASDVRAARSADPVASVTSRGKEKDSSRGELHSVGFGLFLSPQTRSFKLNDQWFEFSPRHVKRYFLLDFIARKRGVRLGVEQFDVSIQDIGWKRWKISDDGLDSAVGRLKSSIGSDFQVVSDAIVVSQEWQKTYVRFDWPPKDSQ